MATTSDSSEEFDIESLFRQINALRRFKVLNQSSTCKITITYEDNKEDNDNHLIIDVNNALGTKQFTFEKILFQSNQIHLRFLS